MGRLDGYAARAPNATADSIISAAREACTLKISVSTPEDATAACAALSVAINTVAAGQSTLLANNKGLTAIAKGNASLSDSLQQTINSIQDLDQVALQAKLQALNNQQGIAYYLVSQINNSATSVLALFR